MDLGSTSVIMGNSEVSSSILTSNTTGGFSESVNTIIRSAFSPQDDSKIIAKAPIDTGQLPSSPMKMMTMNESKFDYGCDLDELFELLYDSVYAIEVNELHEEAIAYNLEPLGQWSTQTNLKAMCRM